MLRLHSRFYAAPAHQHRRLLQIVSQSQSHSSHSEMKTATVQGSGAVPQAGNPHRPVLNLFTTSRYASEYFKRKSQRIDEISGASLALVMNRDC